MNEPLISIIVPVYNVESYLLECLESIRSQTYKNLEVFLINDGSTDQSGSICDHFSKIDPRFKTIHKQNSGLSSTRNLGLSLINGDYIGFVDSDDVCEANMYEVLLDTAKYHQAELVIAGMHMWYQSSYKLLYSSPKEGLIDYEDMTKLIFSLPPWTKTAFSGGYVMPRLYAREAIQGLVFDEDKTICEDELFVSQAFLRCKRIAVTNHRIYRYRQRASSIVNRPNFEIHLLRGRLKIAQIFRQHPHLLQYVNTKITLQVSKLRNSWWTLSESEKELLCNLAKDNYRFAKEQYLRHIFERKNLRHLWWLTQSRRLLDGYMRFRARSFKPKQKEDFFP